MNFQEFLEHSYKKTSPNSVFPPLSSVCDHSQELKKNGLFIAMRGKKGDGHHYISQAVERGAGALLLEDPKGVPSHFKGPVFVYKDQMRSLGQLLNQFYDYPSKKLFTIGITGTNGKTSFCYLLEHIFKVCGWPTGYIGTVQQSLGTQVWPSSLTTPSACKLFERLNDMLKLSAKAVVMEVSSIALDQDRVQGIDFKGLVFSNISQDHLDYHGSMENYFLAKKKLFSLAEQSSQKNLFYLLNRDDMYSHRIRSDLKKTTWTYGRSEGDLEERSKASDFAFKIKKQTFLQTVFEVQSPFGRQDFCVGLTGEYNVYNAVAAVACALLTGFKPEDCQKALKSFKGIPGRLERVIGGQDFEVFIDYAHTPTALWHGLKNLKNFFNPLILVFGCGGNRDKQKRSAMMKVALQFADQIFLTKDNPRDEDPELIVKDCLKGLPPDLKKVTVELDRAKAIEKALKGCKKGSAVLIAGKGHEQFQILKDKKIPFCDKKTALQFL